MEKKKSRRQCRVNAAKRLIFFELSEHVLSQNKNQNAIQKMQQEVNEVVAPNLLAGPQVVQRKKNIEKISRSQHVPAELAEPEIRILLNREQIIEHEWNVEGVPIDR